MRRSIKSKRRLSSSVLFPRTELFAQIEFTEWTVDGHLRHSKFAGLREDKDRREVARESGSGAVIEKRKQLPNVHLLDIEK
jgi:ATP-dependent DNA ligase